jgi:DnaJ-class molecular chaperone
MKCVVLALSMCGAMVQDDPIGTPEQVNHFRIAQNYNQPGKVDLQVEASALASTTFGPRYAGLILKIHRAFELGRGYADVYRALSDSAGGGGPVGAHLSALAAGVKKAVYCTKCQNGKIKCPHCDGKKKFDLKCPDCQGKGYVHSKTEVKATVLQRCNTCNGTGTLKDVACDACTVIGLVNCPDCKGTPWRQEACPNSECHGGKVTCPFCHGKGDRMLKCEVCGGKKRLVAPGASGGFKVGEVCKACHGEGQRKEECTGCGRTGKVLCDTCKGHPDTQKVQASLAEVLSTESCTACNGQGWPERGKAIPCRVCLGLGVKIIPSADPGKTLPAP